MPKNYIHKLYDNWIKKNDHRFNYRPVITKKIKSGYEFQFDGVTPLINGWIGKSGLSVSVQFQGDLIDFIFDYDIIVRRSHNGCYYCNWCQRAYDDDVITT